MSTLPTLPSYSEVALALKTAKISFDPAQIHGLLCGLICGSHKEEINWDMIILRNKSFEGVDILERLYEISYQQMSEFSFEFAILLPEDTTDINQRAEALGLWCQGFLTGLEQCKIALKDRSSSELTETVNDLIEIAKVNYGDITSNEEDEAAYYELIEYVRLAALMVFHELRKGNISRQASDANVLH